MNNQKQKLFQEFFKTMTRMRKMLDQSIAIPADKRVATMLQMQAMEHINQNPGLTAGDLASHLQMSSSAITQLTDRLIGAKLISRKQGEEDRRAIHFKLTLDGKKHLSESLKSIRQKTTQILSSMPKKDIKEVIRIFNNILEKNQK